MDKDLNENQAELITLCEKMAAEVNLAYPIQFGYLFGSRATGNHHAQSDLDLAFRFEKPYPASEELLLRGYLMELGIKWFSRMCAQLPVDVVSLATAPLYLQYKVIQTGMVIFDKGSGCRAEFESLIRREYFDFQYYSDYYNQKMMESIRDQTYFGGTDG